MTFKWIERKGLRYGEETHNYWLVDISTSRVLGYVSVPIEPGEICYQAVSFGESETRSYIDLDVAKKRLEYAALVEDFSETEALKQSVKFKKRKPVNAPA